jgi:trafficking protein particle complex subunit 2
MSMFVLVGSKEPLYKMELKSRKEESAHVDEFLLHSALDIVDELMWTTQSMALKVVDKFNDQFVSAFVTATNVKFLLLHESRNEDTIRAFFHEVHELYLKVSLSDL